MNDIQAIAAGSGIGGVGGLLTGKYLIGTNKLSSTLAATALGALLGGGTAYYLNRRPSATADSDSKNKPKTTDMVNSLGDDELAAAAETAATTAESRDAMSDARRISRAIDELRDDGKTNATFAGALAGTGVGLTAAGKSLLATKDTASRAARAMEYYLRHPRLHTSIRPSDLPDAKLTPSHAANIRGLDNAIDSQLAMLRAAGKARPWKALLTRQGLKDAAADNLLKWRLHRLQGIGSPAHRIKGAALTGAKWGVPTAAAVGASGMLYDAIRNAGARQVLRQAVEKYGIPEI